MENSSYNHVPIGVLPVIPNIEFKKLAERVAVGDFTQNAKMRATYSFNVTQRGVLNTLMDVAKRKIFHHAVVEDLQKF